MEEIIGKLIVTDELTFDIHPRPPMKDAMSIFWRASEESIGAREKPVYVWATNKRYYYSRVLPEGAAIVAEFYRDKMVFCIWGDDQE